MTPAAERVRLRYLYRRLIIRGKIRLPAEAARKMVGPDCAYKLYASTDADGRETGGRGRKRRSGRRSPGPDTPPPDDHRR